VGRSACCGLSPCYQLFIFYSPGNQFNYGQFACWLRPLSPQRWHYQGYLFLHICFKSASDNLEIVSENIKKGFEVKINQHNTSAPPQIQLHTTKAFNDTNNPNPSLFYKASER